MELKGFIFTMVFSFLATISYSIPLNTPKKGLLPGAFAGSIGYILYISINLFGGGYMFSSFISAFIIGSLGEAFSRIFKMPATIFVLPGLIPLVPGGGMYYTMSYLIQDNMPMFLNEAINTFFIAVSLSVGILASTIFSRSLNRFRSKSIPKVKKNK